MFAGRTVYLLNIEGCKEEGGDDLFVYRTCGEEYSYINEEGEEEIHIVSCVGRDVLIDAYIFCFCLYVCFIALRLFIALSSF